MPCNSQQLPVDQTWYQESTKTNAHFSEMLCPFPTLSQQPNRPKKMQTLTLKPRLKTKTLAVRLSDKITKTSKSKLEMHETSRTCDWGLKKLINRRILGRLLRFGREPSRRIAKKQREAMVCPNRSNRKVWSQCGSEKSELWHFLDEVWKKLATAQCGNQLWV